MPDPLWGQQLTNMWMLDPTMFDPTQKSNIYSDYNGMKLQDQGPSYNTGAGGPTNAMGQPIGAFQAWQTANPAGMNINNTPAQAQMQPQQAQQQQQQQPGGTFNYAAMGQQGPAIQQLMNNYQAAQAKLMPQQQYNQQQSQAVRDRNVQQLNMMSAMRAGGGGGGNMPGGAFNAGQTYTPTMMGQGAGSPSPMAQPGGGQASGGPNAWMQALNALSQPGNPITPGANVPMAQGFQPAGGVNQAYLNQVGSGAGMNQNFLSALAAIQGRPQGQQRRIG